jgi:hypothetical protein
MSKIYKTPNYNKNRERILLDRKIDRDNRTEEQIENDKLYQQNYYYMVLKPKRELEKLLKQNQEEEDTKTKFIKLKNPIRLEFS